MVQKAIDEDVKQNYTEAYKQYMNSLDYFMLALKCEYVSNICSYWNGDLIYADEKNEKSRLLIQTKINEYLTRTEVLKEHISSQGEKRSRSAVGVNGSGGSTGGGGTKCVLFIFTWFAHAYERTSAGKTTTMGRTPR